MSDRVRLYAWAAPALDTNALPDHTWVTTYDNRKIPYPDIKAVTAAGEHYWYCWGNFGRKAERREIQQGYWATALAVSRWPLVWPCRTRIAVPRKPLVERSFDMRATGCAISWPIRCCMRRPLREVRRLLLPRRAAIGGASFDLELTAGMNLTGLPNAILAVLAGNDHLGVRRPIDDR